MFPIVSLSQFAEQPHTHTHTIRSVAALNARAMRRRRRHLSFSRERERQCDGHMRIAVRQHFIMQRRRYKPRKYICAPREHIPPEPRNYILDSLRVYQRAAQNVTMRLSSHPHQSRASPPAPRRDDSLLD